MRRGLILLALLLLITSASPAWAAAPSFIQHAEGAGWVSGGIASQAATVTVQTGDILVAGAIGESETNVVFATPTNDGTALVWTIRQSAIGTGNTPVSVWTATADSNRTIVVTESPATFGGHWGMAVRVWRSSAGVGASNKVEGDTTANFSVDLLVTQANSAIDVFYGDFAAVAGARTYLTGAGTFTEKTSIDESQYAVRTGYHADAGAVATYTIGTSAPAGQHVSIVVVEIKGTAAGGAPQRTLMGVGQ